MAVFRLPSIVLTQLKQPMLVLFRPLPTTCGWWSQPAAVTARKQGRPSETTTEWGETCRTAQAASSSLLNDCTLEKTARRGCPCSFVSTAATNGVLFFDPRPTRPPFSSPPRYASSSSMRPDNTVCSSRSHMTCISLCLTRQAAQYPTPNVRISSMAEMMFLDWVIRYMAWNQITKDSLVAWKIVPAVIVVCLWHRLHWNVLVSPCHTIQWLSFWHFGHRNPDGQRIFSKASSHWISVPYSLLSSLRLSPGWNWIRFIAITDSFPGHVMATIS